ncbi:PREDICTED: calponin homology domain-containing protein DDB_G0272472-like [Camelina sativa]|uniref:Calponin homology domain-containing protein DDB_G0272472-like n=1 Tax=Camelina sativa TaxID=90675 RepID=A0ABM0V113_CAMSA|nr:PREDICTED: calponin homology domain-containing protein DDB_G0272472-like [Camelina sativa]
MEMASSEVDLSSCRTFNCVLSRPHERCTRGGDNNNKNKNNNNNVRNIHVAAYEKNLNVFVRDHFENCSVVSGDFDNDDSTKSSVSSDHRATKTEEPRHDVPSSSSSLGSETNLNSGQPENPSRKEKMAASSLVQIWEARTTQQPPSSNQTLIDSRTSSMGSNALENSDSINEESVKDSDLLIQPIEEGNNEEEEEEEVQEIECVSQLVLPPPDSGEKDREKVRVMDIIRKLSNDSETITNNENGSSSNDNSKEVQTTEARCFPQVTCSPRIRGRQAFADLLVLMMRDREKELASLLERHCVSKFTHRGRIQSTLRIRCYERCKAIQDRHRCKPSSTGSDLNRSPRGSGVLHLLRGKYKTNSENTDTAASSTTVSSRGRILDKDPHKATEKKVLQEKNEKIDIKEIQEVVSAVENAKKAVLSEIAENKNGLKKAVGETIQKKATEGRDEKRETKEKAIAKESPELAKEKSVAKEIVEGKALGGIAEKVNIWNLEEKINRRKGMEKGKFEGKANTERVEKNDVLEEATRRIINVESAERSISTTTTTTKETMMPRCEFAEKVIRRKEKEDCVSMESKSKEIEDRNIKPQEVTTQEDNCLCKPIEKESVEEGNTLMGIAEKVNMWNSKEKKHRRRVMEKGKGKTETNEVLQEASRRISNVETAERSIATSSQTVEKVVGNKEVIASVEAKSKEIVEDKNMNPQAVSHGSREKDKEKNYSQHGEKTSTLRDLEAKSTKEIERNNSQEVTQEEESISKGSRERAKEKNSSQQDEKISVLQNPNVENGIQESEDEETKKVECKEKGESIQEAAVEFVSEWDETEMEEEDEYGDYDLYIGENMDDWIHDISRPRSYWEDLRKERYLEVLNTESEKKDICNLIQRRTVSDFLTSDLRQKIDNLMITRVQSHIRVPINQVKEEDEDEEEEEKEEWVDECSARNQENNETEEEPEKPYLEAASDVCSLSSARSSTMMSWTFRDQDIYKDHEPTTTLSLPESSAPTNQSETQTISEVRSQMEQLQREMLELRSSAPTNQSETQTISELRSQVEQLQREMLELRSSFKSCIDMQVHFQKFVTQDLSRSGSSVEERVDSKKDPLKRKCCVCSEMPVDSLLYRCGHMCTCLKCAHELQWSSKKCPICMAPIVDVVRAFLDS